MRFDFGFGGHCEQYLHKSWCIIPSNCFFLSRGGWGGSTAGSASGSLSISQQTFFFEGGVGEVRLRVRTGLVMMRHHHWHHPKWLPHPQDSVAQNFWPLHSQPSPTEVGRISHHRWCLRTEADEKVNGNQQQTCTSVGVFNVFQHIPRKNCQPGLKTHSSHQLDIPR